MGFRLISRGILIFREHVVRPVSSSKVARGSRAKRTSYVFLRDGSRIYRKRTISQSRDHGNQCCIEGVSVVIYASRVDVEDPCGFAWVDAQ